MRWKGRRVSSNVEDRRGGGAKAGGISIIGLIVEAIAPKAEMMDYTIVLKAMTQGRGKFSFKVDHYEEVPGNEAQKIIAAHKAEEDE